MINRDKILGKKTVKKNGFTLVELMVVVAITALIAGFTMAEINSTSHKLKNAARTLHAKMQQAKLLAIKENCATYLDFDLDNNGKSDGTLNLNHCTWRDINNNELFTMKDINDSTVTSKYDSAEFVDETILPSGISIGAVASTDGGPTKGPPTTDPSIPTSGISYGGDRVTFNPQGTGSSGWFYLHAPSKDSSGTYAVGTNKVGRVRTWYCATNGDTWR
ncbi:MAG: GspH/FimT family pseudopilin [Bacteroidota bacterium]|nr:GspH/FimT family pseudopilin [Bacteroidota bacterium]